MAPLLLLLPASSMRRDDPALQLVNLTSCMHARGTQYENQSVNAYMSRKFMSRTCCRTIMQTPETSLWIVLEKVIT
jgi:hypothetical protein